MGVGGGFGCSGILIVSGFLADPHIRFHPYIDRPTQQLNVVPLDTLPVRLLSEELGLFAGSFLLELIAKH